jgi:hypothetical protein
MLLGLSMIGALGCSELKEAMEGEGRAPVNPPGIAPAEAVADPLNANNAQPAPANRNPAPAPHQNEGIVGKTTAKVVDYKKAIAENPNLVVVKNEVRGNDPITVAGSAYIAASSRANAANFQHEIDILRALNDGKYPTFEEYQAHAKRHNIRFSELPAYQMWGYDDQTGQVMILQDQALKAQMREAAGLPPEE